MFDGKNVCLVDRLSYIVHCEVLNILSLKLFQQFIIDFINNSKSVCVNLFFNVFFSYLFTVGLSPNVPSPGTISSAALFPGGPSPSTLSALVSQHRLLELSRFGLRGYDLAQHMLTQQGAVSKLLGKCSFVISIFIIFYFWWNGYNFDHKTICYCLHETAVDRRCIIFIWTFFFDGLFILLEKLFGFVNVCNYSTLVETKTYN